MSDNTTAVSYINAMGCKSLECNSLTQEIWNWAIVRNIWLSATHIPGSSNDAAVQLSRDLKLDLEWMLSVHVFKRIVALFGQPDIHLFASRRNAQVETYVSWKPHPMAKFVDAFTVDWTQFFLLCISPFLSYFQTCAKNNPKPGNRNFDNPEVDNSAILNSCAGPSDRHTTSSRGFCSESCSSNSGRSSSTTSPTGVTGMQIIRQSLQKSEFSPDIVEIIMNSWRDSTHKQYRVYINKWLQFGSERSHDPLRPTVRPVLFFLHSFFEKGLSYSALNTARSAVSNIDTNSSGDADHTPVGKHFLVCRYLKGVFNKLKPVPKYNNYNIWSVDTVLDYLSLYWPLDKMTLKELTLKLVMLIALTKGQRRQTLTFLDMSEKYMQSNGECFNFALTDHLKQDRPGKVFGNVRLYMYPVKELRVYETLNYYRKATENLRNSTRLLVSYIKPYRAVTSSTIGRWIKTMLGQAFNE